MDNEAALFKVLAEPTRLRLVTLLAMAGERCVCQLAQALEEPEYKISRHLGIMRSAGLVQTRREGTWIFYQLSQSSSQLETCLHDCFKVCFKSHPVTQEDMQRLQRAACGPIKQKK
ncbi:MAG: ArsR/SmtB family transcription factor [Planctomycetota bacterium]|jgi:ArsR family transcriptional regulator